MLLSLDYVPVEEPPDYIPIENNKLSLDSIPVKTSSPNYVSVENVVIKGSTIYFKEL